MQNRHLAMPRRMLRPKSALLFQILAFGFSLVLLSGLRAQASNSDRGESFDFTALQARASTMAAEPYVPKQSNVPESLRRLSYDDYRQIAFDQSESKWAREQLPFRLQFFHPGFVQIHTVRVSEVFEGHAREIPFSTKLFDYRNNIKSLGEALAADAQATNMGFSGLRLLYPLNDTSQFSELAVFQGASYFRALSRDARYGLSARGLALNTGEPGGEEFPTFEEFWIERPILGATSIRLWALMDSPSVTGAYEFLIKPGTDTVMDVNAVIFRRASAGDSIKVLGVAPLTSMFWFGTITRGRADDLRPEVHDSDGLSVHTGAGEWLWRPLENPNAIRVTVFSDENPRGFGLMQRARAFSDYEDIEAAYHLRPSTWVEPIGKWGRGSVRLVELPTPDETNDNIVAFWTPETLPPAGEPLRISYRLHWFVGTRAESEQNTGIVSASRQGHSLTHEPDLRRFWVDFASDDLARLPASKKIDAVVSVGKGATLVHATAEKNPFNNTWRAGFAIKPDGSGAPVELRCFLRSADGNGVNTLTETWSYLWMP